MRKITEKSSCGVTIPLVLLSEVRERDIDNTPWFSLFMTPIKFQHFFDMYFDTILE